MTLTLIPDGSRHNFRSRSIQTSTRPPTNNQRTRPEKPRRNDNSNPTFPRHSPQETAHFSPFSVNSNPKAWAATILRASCEAMTGARPISQLQRYLNNDLFLMLKQRRYQYLETESTNERISASQVRSLRGRKTAQGEYIAAATVYTGNKLRAATLTLSPFRGRWLTTGLEII